MSHITRHRVRTVRWVSALVSACCACLAPAARPSDQCPAGPGHPPLPSDATGRVECAVTIRRTTVHDLSLLAGVTSLPGLALDDLPALDLIELPRSLRTLGRLHVVDSVADAIETGSTAIDVLWVQRSAVRRISGRQRQLRALVVEDARALHTFDFPALEELGELALVDTDSLHVLRGFPSLARLGRLLVADAEALEVLDLPPSLHVDRVEFWLNPKLDASVRESWLAGRRAVNPDLHVFACGGPGLERCLDELEINMRTYRQQRR